MSSPISSSLASSSSAQCPLRNSSAGSSSARCPVTNIPSVQSGAVHADIIKTTEKKRAIDLKFLPNIHREDALTTTLKTTKGAGDALGLLSRLTRLVSMVSPEKMGWASHVSQVTGQARAALAIPNFLCASDRLQKSFEKKKFATIAKDGLDVVASAACAGSLLTTDRANAAALGGIAGVFKTVSDSVELAETANKFFEYSDMRAAIKQKETEGEDHLPDYVKKGLDTEYVSTALKLGRLALGIFGGVVAALAFIFKVTLSKELLILGAAASLASIVCSVGSELVKANADYSLVPEKHFEATKSAYAYKSVEFWQTA